MRIQRKEKDIVNNGMDAAEVLDNWSDVESEYSDISSDESEDSSGEREDSSDEDDCDRHTWKEAAGF